MSCAATSESGAEDDTVKSAWPCSDFGARLSVTRRSISAMQSRGRAAEDVGTLSLFEGSEAAVDGEAPTEGLADRDGPGQRRPWQKAQPLAKA